MRKLLLLLGVVLLCMQLSAQQRTISGKVTDQNGAPIPLASVVIKGKKNIGTITDAQGNYNIPVLKGGVLIISSLSFTTREVTVGSSTTLNVHLLQLMLLYLK